MGMMPTVMPMLTKAWKASMDTTPAASRAPKGPSKGGDPKAAPEQQPEQGEQGHGAGEAELLADHGEDEVGLLLGHVLEVGLGAAQVALAPDPARADGDQGLPRVVGETSSTVVGARVDERGQALLLVLAQDVELEHADRPHHPDQRQDQQPAQLDPADQQHPEQD